MTLAVFYLLMTQQPSALSISLGDPATGTYAQRANLAIPQSMVDGQNTSGGLCIGKSWTGPGGSAFSGHNWDGGVNNMIAADMVLTAHSLKSIFKINRATLKRKALILSPLQNTILTWLHSLSLAKIHSLM